MTRDKSNPPRAWIVYESVYSDGECAGHTVHEFDDAFQPRPTGVLDAKGRMIFRNPEAIGFRVRRP